MFSYIFGAFFLLCDLRFILHFHIFVDLLLHGDRLLLLLLLLVPGLKPKEAFAANLHDLARAELACAFAPHKLTAADKHWVFAGKALDLPAALLTTVDNEAVLAGDLPQVSKVDVAVPHLLAVVVVRRSADDTIQLGEGHAPQSSFELRVPSHIALARLSQCHVAEGFSWLRLLAESLRQELLHVAQLRLCFDFRFQ